MSHSRFATGSGSGTVRNTFEFGRTNVVKAQRKAPSHYSLAAWLGRLRFKLVPSFGDSSSSKWFGVGDISEDALEDAEGLDATATHVANLLSTEPADVKLGIGGFSMGAATALYSATCHVLGKYGNGNPYLVNLSAVVGISGWLLCSRALRIQMEGLHNVARRAAYLPILVCHGSADDVIACQHGQKSAEALTSAGFRNLTFRTYNGLGHYTVPEQMDEICNWLTAWLGLEGSRSC